MLSILIITDQPRKYSKRDDGIRPQPVSRVKTPFFQRLPKSRLVLSCFEKGLLLHQSHTRSSIFSRKMSQNLASFYCHVTRKWRDFQYKTSAIVTSWYTKRYLKNAWAHVHHFLMPHTGVFGQQGTLYRRYWSIGDPAGSCTGVVGLHETCTGVFNRDRTTWTCSSRRHRAIHIPSLIHWGKIVKNGDFRRSSTQIALHGDRWSPGTLFSDVFGFGSYFLTTFCQRVFGLVNIVPCPTLMELNRIRPHL